MFSREKIVAYMPIGKWSTPNQRNGSKKKKNEKPFMAI